MVKQKVKKKSRNNNVSISNSTNDNGIGNVSKKKSSAPIGNRSSTKIGTICSITIIILISIVIANYDIIISKLSSYKQQQQSSSSNDNETKRKIIIYNEYKYQKHSRKSNQKFNILDELFPNNILDDAWEKYPLLVTSSSSSNKDTNKSKKNIPTYEITNTQDKIKRKKLTSSIFSLQSLEKMLSLNHHKLKHGDDYHIAKKIMKDNGEEWMGRLPQHTIPLEAITNHLYYGGFSLIVNKVQRLWGSVGHMSRLIHDDILCNYVSCNLYMTPPVLEAKKDNNVRSAFEAHYDWMDVIIIQITGSKLWNVATQPLLPLSTHDLKRKPTLSEHNIYLNNVNYSYNEFLLNVGDVLYIPRGYIHNASTVYDASNSNKEPSIHLSFGIEHLCETTWEAFLHFSLVRYTKLNNFLNKDIATQCNNVIIPWNILLHYTISAMARLDVIIASKQKEEAYLLRKSIPLHPLWNDIRAYNNTYDNMFIQILHYVKENVNIKHTLSLFHLFQINNEMKEHFCIPSILQPLSIPNFICNNIDTTAKTKLQNSLLNHFYSFLDYINDKTMYETMMNDYLKYLNEKKSIAFKNDDDLLSTIGQSI